ncbi:MAG: MBL fold metallo-hydrolase [Bacteroidia bacterium]|nr:MBL fold metallo-hydrolase [Bacteroidia bacterium]
MRKILKWTLITFVSILSIALITGILFINISPQFGGKATEEELQAYSLTGHFDEGVFLNKEEIKMEVDCHSIQKMLQEMLEPDPNVSPKEDIKVKKIEAASIVQKPDSISRLTWFGHSTFLVEMDGKNILFDPVFGQYAAPHPLLGRKRYNSEMPISIADLPQIDAVIISHDHYDHLDYESIKELKEKTEHFFVPLGVDNHLERWGIAEDKISKMDWWQEKEFNGLTIAFTPSRHMSGRGLTDQSATLWGSWVLQGKSSNIFFSGDGGYGKHFKEIGDKYGDFDIALMECGQYNKLWAQVHMMPEQTVQAGIDVKAKMIVPIHWGAFTLASHSWTDPIERVTKAAQEMSVEIATPQIGEPIILGEEDIPKTNWWTANQ